ncbi:MAG: putative internal virion protein [Prokaryotic dsDNA virus sp.]|nr:MAG: putative internal virion protein [Prokaryotic dsDNA virus sp.]|tara:strand:+ start:7298 stop:7813 length:516 start_codon:yes stop_codon:yes gene_type:complete
MCNPVAILSGLQAGAQFYGQRQQAKQQIAYQRQASIAEQQRAQQEQTSIRMRQGQEQEATAREINEMSKKAREAVSTAKVSAGEAGVSGVSVDALLTDYENQSLAYNMGITRQQEMKDVQTGLALTDAGFRTMNNQIGINRPVNKPSFLEGALSVGSSAISGYRSGLELKR